MNQHGENGSLNFIPPYIVNHENEELKQVYIYLTENYISGENCHKCKKYSNYQSVVGYDCHSLYSYAIKQEMPSGMYN